MGQTDFVLAHPSKKDANQESLEELSDVLETSLQTIDTQSHHSGNKEIMKQKQLLVEGKASQSAYDFMFNFWIVRLTILEE